MKSVPRPICDSMSAEERLLKLKQLQKKRAEAARENRQELFKEHREKAIGKEKLRQLEEKQERSREELEKIRALERGEDYQRRKAWDYTIEENEKWDAKLERRAQNRENAGFKNYSQMAEQAYNKEISQITVDKDRYKLQKAKDGHGTSGVDFHNKPSKEAVDTLVSTLKTGDSRRMKKKSKEEEDTDSYSEYIYAMCIKALRCLRQY